VPAAGFDASIDVDGVTARAALAAGTTDGSGREDGRV
jgi:hypothetical protein